MERLDDALRRIDGRPYPAYKDIKGVWSFEDYDLEIVHVQGDPFATPSKIKVSIPIELTDIEPEDIETPSRRTGVEDALLRSFSRAVPRRSSGGRGGRGSGKSGQWGVVRLGQEILPRSGCEIREGRLHLRFTIGLPAQGRRIRGRQAAEMLLDELPDMLDAGIFDVDLDLVKAHADAAEDQDHLRGLLREQGWVAFIANGAVLPRRSGVDDRPLDRAPVPWQSPPDLEASVDLPHAGRLFGTAIPEGITLICGGGYHGKSTVLRALSHAVFNHVPNDGREHCAARFDAAHVRAEDGRRICGVDISPFISDLPDGRSTAYFVSDNASGSTSQAANIVEALELGTTCLLIDEDTSATNFMVRDRRMQALIASDREPITPFVDRARELVDVCGVSTVLVVGGSGDFFEIADTVIVMDDYRPRHATDRARQIAAKHPSGRLNEPRAPLSRPTHRVPSPASFNARKGRRAEKVRTRETRTIELGEQEIEVSLLAQLVDDGQTRAIGDWLLLCGRQLADGHRTLEEICSEMERDVVKNGLAATCARGAGDRVLPRRFEFAAAINRLRSLGLV